ncbi:tyrosine-type recombinase/integrase [Ensifer aridi]|uniref:tyrosine-type recombinase/integrase n=1 Tax=Ensifer aridi TaxID=1708715 RepID=UPI000A1045DF|nr:integrase arm-type DNA-binding domain-containing protein [Ensifer aridi]
MKPQEKPSALDMARLLAQAYQSGERIETLIPNCPGLYLISFPSGKQSWAYRYRRPGGGSAKLTLGPKDESLDLAGARAKAQECRKLLKRKIDPATAFKEEKSVEVAKEVGWTFDALLTAFAEWYEPPRATTKKQTLRWLGLKPDSKKEGKWIPTGNGFLGKWKGRVFSRHDGSPVITAVDATEILDDMKTVSRNRARSALKIFGRWASSRGKGGKPYVSVDPFAGLRRERKDREKPRERWLEDWEIKALWQSAVAEPDAYGLGALLILATGQRPEMTFEARWEQFDLGAKVWRIPAEAMKIDKPHTVHLSEQALWVIGQLPQKDSGYLFEPEGKEKRPLNWHVRPKVRLEGRADTMAREMGRPSLAHWTYKDLQRSAITGMERIGIWPHVTKAVQGHAQGSKSDQAYRHYDFAGEVRLALDKWGRHLAQIVGG